MTDSLVHRGPDDRGVWVDETVGLALGHRRLAVVDLSSAGHQPMQSACGRYVIVFNGEIYNHLELRDRLSSEGSAPAWQGHSDTETLLACIVSWTTEKTLRALTGMFAFALWDRQEKLLTLARDRLGEKPLYYGWQGSTLLFGSELKALVAHPNFKGDINRGALSLLLRLSYIPAPYSIYQDISKLEPGTFLVFSASSGQLHTKRYWSGAEVADRGVKAGFEGSPEAAIAEVERLASRSIGRQMVADVPLGAFLSGGIDSSTVVALMQAQSSRPIKTFTIGNNNEAYDEAVHAAAVARHLGTEHTELYITPQQALDVIPRLPVLYDEPFADSSQIPTLLVSELAKTQVTVALSGDGGDELFAGYNRHKLTAQLWRRLVKVPLSVRKMAAKGIMAMSPEQWDSLGSVLPGDRKAANFGDKLHKGASVLASGSVNELYTGLVSAHMNPSAWVIGGGEPPMEASAFEGAGEALVDVERMMILDLLTYLPDDILAKVDRAAMAASLEVRVPFLDHELIEFAWQLPLALKLRNGQSKWLLRQVLYRYVPHELVERPKMGFSIPLDSWLRGPLRAWVESLINEDRLRSEGFFHPGPIRSLWEAHLTGKNNHARLLWNILTFQMWREEWYGISLR